MTEEINTQIDNFLKKSPRPLSKFSIWRNGELYETSRGYAKSSFPDVFEIGSTGKTLTTTLLSILEEKGLLNINDKAKKFRPDLPFADEITLKQLASHTAGMPGNPYKKIIYNDKGFQKHTSNFRPETLNEFLRDIRKPLRTGKFKYSNCGMALLGSILADCAGLAYEEAVRHYILQPLGMLDTHLHWQHYSKDRVAKGHDKKGKLVHPFWWEGMEPAGVWRSTTNDMMLFLKAQLGYAGDDWKGLAIKTTLPTLNKSKGYNIGQKSTIWLLLFSRIKDLLYGTMRYQIERWMSWRLIFLKQQQMDIN
jgi:D-alanyl-D-alanine-carboxypeptidase/D-alanyl-D-alanine-endopeptidase